MKKYVSFILVLASLLVMTGCGKKIIAVDDGGSLYPSNYEVKKDGRLVINIEGDWGEDAHWRAVYDEEVLTCEEGKDGKSFIFSSLGPETAEIDLQLYRGEAEDWEYDLWYYVQGDGLGGVRILLATHLDAQEDGSYTYEQGESGELLFRIHTTHSWESRTLAAGIDADMTGCGEDHCVFSVTADTGASGRVEIYDKAGSLMLTLTVHEKNGEVILDDVESSTDTAFGQDNLDFFWSQLGIAPMIPAGVTVEDAEISTSPEYVFPCGDMELIIDGQSFDFSVSLDENWIHGYYPDTEVNADNGEAPEPSTEEQIEINSLNVTVFTQANHSMAVWNQYGMYFGMEGECDKDTLIKALGVMLEV